MTAAFLTAVFHGVNSNAAEAQGGFMRRTIQIAIAAAYMVCALAEPSAQGIFGSEGNTGPRWSGSFSTDLRTRLEEPWRFQWQEYRLNLQVEADFGRRGHLYADTWLRGLGFAQPANTAALTQTETVLPVQMLLREAYIDIYGLGLDGLDLRIGRQLIPWGSAYQFNPVNALNAHDLEDIFDFGRRLGADAVKLSWYSGPWEIEGAFVPYFRPAVLPGEDIWNDLAAASEIALPASLATLVDIQHISDTLDLPAATPADGAQGGVRIASRLGGFDLALSYVYGRDDFPVAGGVMATLPDTVTAERLVQILMAGETVPAHASVSFVFPRRHVFGLAIAGALADVGVWSELALFFPEKVKTKARLAPAPAGMSPLALQALDTRVAALLRGEEVVIDDALDDKPYLKAAIGGDYTFTNGIYINAQYLRGFVHERGGNLGNFLVTELSWDLPGDRLTIMPLGAGLEIADFGDIENSYALLYQPEATWKPFDNLDLAIGIRIIEARENSSFEALDNRDHVYFRTKYMF